MKVLSPCSCFISNVIVFFVAFLGPIFVILLFNIITFIIVIKALIKHTRKKIEHTDENESKYSSILRLLISTVGIMTTFGLTWLFGAFTILDASLPFQILFTVFNSFQGFFIFLFYCVISNEARQAWYAVLPCKKARWTVTKSGTASTHMPLKSRSIPRQSETKHQESETIANPTAV